MPNTSVSPTPVSARIVPVMIPFTTSWARCWSTDETGPNWREERGSAPARSRSLPQDHLLWFVHDRLDDLRRTVSLVLPDVIGESIHATVGGKVQIAGCAHKVNLLARHHRLDGIVELLEGVFVAGIVGNRNDVPGNLRWVARPCLKCCKEGDERAVKCLSDKRLEVDIRFR